MADLTLSDFDVIPWTQADEATRPDVEVGEIPAELSAKGQRLLNSNAMLRGLFDGSIPIVSGDSSDSGRVYRLAILAGRSGMGKADTARLIVDYYEGQPGRKKLHRIKLEKTLRGWAKGVEEATREEAAHPAPVDETDDPIPAACAPGDRSIVPENGRPGEMRDKGRPFEVLPAAEFLANSFPGAARLVPRIGLTECGVGLITGASGDGKSVLGLNLALAWTGLALPIADAIPAARRLRVIVFQVEDEPGLVHERLRLMLGPTPAPAGLLLFTRKEPMRFSGAKGRPNEWALARLQATLRAHAPVDVAIFDPLVYLHEAEENSSSEMTRWLVPLREACRAVGTAPVIIHHAGWAPDGEDARGRGSTAIRAWADLELALRAHTRGGRTLHRVNLVKTNFAPRWKAALALELNPATLHFEVVDETGTLCPPEALVAWLREEHGGNWTGKREEMYEAICRHFGCERRTAQEAVKRGKDLKLLVDSGQRKPLRIANSSEVPR